MFSILSIGFSIPLVRTSILRSEGEASPFAYHLLSFLTLARFASKFASTVTVTLYMSSKVGGFLSLSWNAISVSNPLGNFINFKSGGGLRLTGIALYILLNLVQ